MSRSLLLVPVIIIVRFNAIPPEELVDEEAPDDFDELGVELTSVGSIQALGKSLSSFSRCRTLGAGLGSGAARIYGERQATTFVHNELYRPSLSAVAQESAL
ncbi:hypothetical protein FB451DRAFT_1178042 [Mycena latifolia]|nr:hypothetical protein FB451DRAFT_1178042 [Mycena latifolia]